MRRRGRPGLLGTAARTAVIAGTAQASAGAVARRQAERAQASQQVAPAPQAAPPAPVAAAPAPAPATDGDDIVAKIERLAALHASGVLTDAEFAAAKAAALG